MYEESGGGRNDDLSQSDDAGVSDGGPGRLGCGGDLRSAADGVKATAGVGATVRGGYYFVERGWMAEGTGEAVVLAIGIQRPDAVKLRRELLQARVVGVQLLRARRCAAGSTPAGPEGRRGQPRCRSMHAVRRPAARRSSRSSCPLGCPLRRPGLPARRRRSRRG